MKKYLNRQFAKKLLMTGACIVAVSFILDIVTLFSVYGKVGDCDKNAASCTLGIEQTLVKIAMATAYIGTVIIVVGLAVLLLALLKKRKI